MVSVAERDQLLAQTLEIVDLAIEDDLHRTVLVAHRLVPGRQIDDRQSPMSEPDTMCPRAGGRLVEALIVRAAMCDGIGHAPQRGTRVGTAREHEAGYATHDGLIAIRTGS